MNKYFLLTLLLTIQTAKMWADALSWEMVQQRAKTIDLSTARSQKLEQEWNLKIQQSKKWPLIYGDASLQRNLIVPVTPVPAIAFDPNAGVNDITPLRFATDWSAKAGLQLSLDIFNPQNQYNRKEASYQLTKAEIEIQNQEQTFKNTLIDIYAQGILAQEQEQIALTILNQYNESYDIIINRYEAGRASLMDKNNADKKKNELMYQYKEAAVVTINKKLLLSQYVDMQIDDTLTTNINQLLSQANTQQSIDVLNKKNDIDWINQKIQLKRAEMWPKISLNGYYGANYFQNNLQIFNANHWYGNSFVSLGIRVPLTELWEKSKQIQQLHNQFNLYQEQLIELNKKDNIASTQKENELKILKEKLKMQLHNLDLSQSNVTIINEQFEAGKILLSDVFQSLELLMKDKQAVLQCYYDMIKKSIE